MKNKAFILTFFFFLSFQQGENSELKIENHATNKNKEFKIVGMKNESENTLLVIDDNMYQRRFMFSGKSIIGGVYLDSELTSLYPGFDILSSIYFTKPQESEHCLIIGLGAGIVDRSFRRFGLVCDIVEIDNEVVFMAEKYFGWNKPPPSHLFIQDAHQFLTDYTKKRAGYYNFIIHDIFSGGSTASHLMTTQVFHQIKQLLKPDGVLVLNFYGFSYSSEIISASSTRAVDCTLKSVFPIVYAYQDVPFEIKSSQFTPPLVNIQFFASCSPFQFHFPEQWIANRENFSMWSEKWIQLHFLDWKWEWTSFNNSLHNCEFLIEESTTKQFSIMQDSIQLEDLRKIENILPPKIWNLINTF